MNRAILTRITKNNREYIAYALLDENRRFIDFTLFDESEASLINDIYVARISKVLPGISGAFVTIAPNQHCYLPFANAANPIYTNKKSKKDGLCVGDELLVAVVKDAIKTKDPVVDTKLTVFGDNLILTSGKTGIGISKKIAEEERLRLKGLLENELEEDRDYGIVARTKAGVVDDSKILSEARGLIDKYNAIKSKAPYQTLYTKLYSSDRDYILKLNGLDFSKADYILTDCNDLYELIKDRFPCQLYNDKSISLQMLYKFSTNMDRLTNRTVWLDSGANLIFEQLETLTVIDVNTSKSSTDKSDSILSTNLEAAKEICMQLKLRNISGMIIVDFINMDKEEDKDKLIECLKSHLKADVIPSRFVDITKLGLVEITRKKQYKSLKEILTKTLD